MAIAASLAACGSDPVPGEGTPAPTDMAAAPSSASLVGTWRLDAETREWLPRSCVLLDFKEPERATFEIEGEGGDLFVRLHNPARTVWRAPDRDQTFVGQQILPTTESGRFCGKETPVRLRLRETRPGVLTGVWQTPSCDVCPDRHFGAIRHSD